MVRVEGARKIYKRLHSSTYLGSAVTETPDESVAITRRTHAYLMCIKRYLLELFDQPKGALSLKTSSDQD